jgi:hypothetical protein
MTAGDKGRGGSGFGGCGVFAAAASSLGRRSVVVV